MLILKGLSKSVSFADFRYYQQEGGMTRTQTPEAYTSLQGSVISIPSQCNYEHSKSLHICM